MEGNSNPRLRGHGTLHLPPFLRLLTCTFFDELLKIITTIKMTFYVDF